MKWLWEKLEKNHGTYTFDLTDPEDAGYVMERLGGEELLKTKFPGIYEAFQGTVKRLAESEGEEGEEEDDRIALKTPDLSYRKIESGTSFKGTMTGSLCDPRGTVQNLGIEKARPWPRAFVTASIADSDDRERPAFASFTRYYSNVNEFSSDVETDGTIDTNTVAKTNIGVITEITGMDPDGEIRAKAVLDEYANNPGGVAVVDRIAIEDPKFKNNSQNNPIIMLYGRETTQNEKYTSADYTGGEYADNNGGESGDKNLKTLMPLKGTIVLKKGFEFKGLYEPDEKHNIYRPTISLDSMVLAEYYSNKWDDKDDSGSQKKMYEAIKGCFQIDEKNKNVCYFDVKIDKKADWQADIKNAAQYLKSNERTLIYLVSATFRLAITDGMLTSFVNLTIRSTEDKDKQLYVTENGSSVVYIPPVQVYWGCLAEDSRILTDCGYRDIADIKPGDRVFSYEKGYVTVAQVLKGHEEKIYRIKTEKETIGLTAGHPVLLADGGEARPKDLERGMLLAGYGGEAAKITDICEEDYQKEVYNLMTEESEAGLHICVNGLFAGDVAAQNRNQEKERIVTEEEKALYEEWDRLQEYLESQRG